MTIEAFAQWQRIRGIQAGGCELAEQALHRRQRMERIAGLARLLRTRSQNPSSACVVTVSRSSVPACMSHTRPDREMRWRIGITPGRGVDLDQECAAFAP